MTQSSSKILIVYAHPDPQASHINQTMRKMVENVAGVTVSDLYEKYPDFYIDVRQEQRLLLSHDLIVFQHPIYWYSCPAILKQWQEMVLEHGFAYGANGDALRDKHCLLVLSAGGERSAYQSNAMHGFAFDVLIKHLQQTIRFCGMRDLPPLVFFGAQDVEAEDIQAQAQLYAQLLSHYISEGVDALKEGLMNA